MHTQTLDPVAMQPHAVPVCIHVSAWITTHLSTPEERKAELAELADPQRKVYPQSRVNHRSIGHRSAKVASRRPKT